MNQLDLPIEAARERGHGAASAAADHSDRIESDWTVRATQMLVAYAHEVARPFLVEEARRWALEHGLPEAVEPRAWGAVTQRASRDGVIEAAGYRSAVSSNGSPKVLWRLVAVDGPKQLELAA
jgi:hypothetical protein